MSPMDLFLLFLIAALIMDRICLEGRLHSSDLDLSWGPDETEVGSVLTSEAARDLERTIMDQNTGPSSGIVSIRKPVHDSEIPF